MKLPSQGTPLPQALPYVCFSHDGRSATLLNKHTIQEHPNLELTALPQDPQFLPLAPHHLLPPLPRNRWSLPPPLLKAMRSPRDATIHLIEAVRAALGKTAGAATTAGAAAVGGDDGGGGSSSGGGGGGGGNGGSDNSCDGMSAVAATGRVAMVEAAVAVAASPTALPFLTTLMWSNFYLTTISSPDGTQADQKKTLSVNDNDGIYSLTLIIYFSFAMCLPLFGRKKNFI